MGRNEVHARTVLQRCRSRLHSLRMRLAERHVPGGTRADAASSERHRDAQPRGRSEVPSHSHEALPRALGRDAGGMGRTRGHHHHGSAGLWAGALDDRERAAERPLALHRAGGADGGLGAALGLYPGVPTVPGLQDGGSGFLGARLTGALVAGGLCVLALLEAHGASLGGTQHAGAEVIIIGFIAATALAAAAGALRSVPKPDNPIRNKNNPTSLAEEGDFVPLLVGRRQVGPMYAWAGNREIVTRELDSGDGKFGGPGGSGGEEQIYFESAWHVLAVGPAGKLWNIRRNGKMFWKGPITPDSHPSGTTIDFGPPGSFTVYWGEDDQPENTNLGNSTRVTISSRWPGYCYIHWKRRRLGRSPVWNQYTYEMEVRPQTSLLTQTPAWIEGTQTLSGRSDAIVSASDGAAGAGTVVVAGDRRKRYRPGEEFKVTGNAMDQTELTVLDSSYSKGADETTFTIAEAITSSDNAGSIEEYADITDDGANGAHVLAQLLFAPWPHGRGLDTEDFDLDSLEALGVLLASEGIAVSFMLRDGEELRAGIADLLTDLGVMIPLNPRTGLYEFVSIRRPWGATFDLATLPSEMLLPPLPSVTTNHSEKASDRMVFRYARRDKKFRQATLPHDDDGSMNLHGIQNVVEVDLETVIDTRSAEIVAARRSQESEANAATFKFNMGREARAFYPGLAFVVEGYPGVLRIVNTKPIADTSKTEVWMVTDFYGATPLTKLTTPPPAADDEEPVEADPSFSFIELPKYVSPGVTRIIIPRIRANASVESADIHISRDDVTYTRKGSSLSIQAGGVLVSGIAATDGFSAGGGPNVTVQGPDIAQVADYSADDTNWRLGRQIAVIGDEIFFLDSVTVIDPNTVQLNRMLRGRYGTERATHASGTAVFIFDIEDIETWEDILFTPGSALYVKAQPFAGEPFPLDEIDAVSKTLVGRGVVPMRPESLRTTNKRNDFATGEDVPLKWVYRSTADVATGAGMQPSGSPFATPSDVQGTFTLELLDSGDVLKQTVAGLTSPSYTIDNADLVSWFDAAEPASFKARLTNVHGGYSSESIEITIERV